MLREIESRRGEGILQLSGSFVRVVSGLSFYVYKVEVLDSLGLSSCIRTATSRSDTNAPDRRKIRARSRIIASWEIWKQALLGIVDLKVEKPRRSVRYTIRWVGLICSRSIFEPTCGLWMAYSQIRLSVHLVKLACRVLLKCILHELREGSLRSGEGLSLLLRFLILSLWREVHLLSTKRSKHLLVDKARLGLSSQRVSLLHRLMSLLFTAWLWIFELLELF